MRDEPDYPAGLAIHLSENPPGPQLPPPDPGDYDYTIISSLAPETGGASYPFLDGLGRHWTIVQQDLDKLDEAIHPAHTFGMDEPTLQIVRDNAVVKIYVDGMTKDDYCQASGLRLHPEVKGQYVMGKRLSRIMRPHYVAGEFEPDEVNIAYLDSADYPAFTTPTLSQGQRCGMGRAWSAAGCWIKCSFQRIPHRQSPSAAPRAGEDQPGRVHHYDGSRPG